MDNKDNRTELDKVLAFIFTCTEEEACLIVNEVLMMRPIMAFDRVRSSVDEVESVCLNGQAIQLNLAPIGKRLLKALK